MQIIGTDVCLFIVFLLPRYYRRLLTDQKEKAKRSYQIPFILQFTSSCFTLAMTNSVWIPINFTQTQPDSASPPANARHLQPPAPGLLPWCWHMKVHPLESSTYNLKVQGPDATLGKPVSLVDQSWVINSSPFYSEGTALRSYHLHSLLPTYISWSWAKGWSVQYMPWYRQEKYC